MTNRLRHTAPWLATLLVLGLLLAGCTSHDDEGDTPTAAPRPSVASGSLATTVPSTAKASPAAAKPAGTPLSDVNGQQISDGVCQAFIPDGWVDDGTGHGATPSGAQFTLFGGVVSSDAAWQAGVSAVATPGPGRAVASIQQTATSIRVLYAGDKGFEYRARFGNRYCDFSVYRVAGAIPAAERAAWDPLIATLRPLS